MGKGTKDPDLDSRLPPSNVKELFWCDARDEHGHLQHAPDCEHRVCLVVQGKRPKLPDHYR